MTKMEAAATRPWISHYPDNINWDIDIDTAPVHDQVLAACAQWGAKPALDFLGATISFEELGRRIRAFAGALQRDFGVTKGTRVALLLPNTPFYPIAYYGILAAGGTVVNCNPLYSVRELAHITSNAGADLMVTLNLKQVFEKAEALHQMGHIKKAIVADFPQALPPVKRILFSIVKRKDLANLRASAMSGNLTDFGELIDQNVDPQPVSIDPLKDVAVQQYTGGTTGLPKGAQLTHANIAANMSQIDAWGLGVFRSPSKVVAVLPFFHIFAMTVCMNAPLSGGATVIMLPRFELKAFLDMLVRTRPNLLPAVPTLLHAVASAPKSGKEHLESLEVIISGGAPLPNETRRLFALKSDALLAEGYGLTECSPVLTCAPLREPSKPMSIGQPLPATDIRFVDLEEPSSFVALGERGELVAKGPQVMPGYYQNDEANEKAFVNGWFRTGDVGYMDEEGFVFLVDRIKDLILCSGFNVYPRTIEEALVRHEAVDECTVIGVPDNYRGEAPIAFVKLVDGKQASQDELLEYLKSEISKIELPREIIFKDALPKTLIGKLSKVELRHEYAATHGGTGE